jgi:hypothetical protein
MAATAKLSFPRSNLSERRNGRPFTFFSTCPVCREERLQYAYTRRALVNLLQSGPMVDAYCTKCDGVWHVSAQERAALASMISVLRALH